MKSSTTYKAYAASGIVLLALVIAIPFQAAGEKANKAQPILAMGDYEYPPYEFLDSSGTPAGYNVDLMRAITRVMGLDVEIRLGPWAEVRGELEKKRIDMLLGMYHSPARDRLVDFSDPHTIIHHTIFVRKGSAIKSLKDLHDKQVIVQKGDIMHDYAVENDISRHLILAASQIDALRALSSGKYDAALLAESQGLYNAKKHELLNITTAGPPFQPREYCFAVREGDRELSLALNRGIAILKSTGRYEEIYNKWLGTMKGPSPVIEWLFPWGIAGILLLTAAVAAAFAWTWALKRQVKQRTSELNEELARRKLTEAELRITNTLLITQQETALDGILIVDNQRTILSYNRRFAEIWAIPESVLESRSDDLALSFVSRQLADPSGFMALVQHLYDHPGETSSDEIPLVDGRILARYSSPIFSGPGERLGRVWYFRDITGEKQAINKILESETRYRALFENANDAIFTLQDNIFVDCNTKTCEMFGCTRDDVIGSSPPRFSPVFQPDGSDSAKKSLEKISAAIRGQPQFFEWVHTKLDGTLFCTEVSLSRVDIMGQPLVQAVVRDITKRKQVEEKLSSAKKQIEDIMEFIPDATLVIDKNGKVIIWNKAIEQMTGCPASEMLGRGNYEYAIPFYGERRPILIDLVLLPKEQILREYTIVKFEGDLLIGETNVPVVRGRKRFLSGWAHPIYNAEGEIIGAIECIRDITEKRDAEEALRASEETFRALAENTSDVIMRFDLDGRHLYVNPAVERETGISPSAFIGKNHRELGFPPELCDLWENTIRSVIKSATNKRIEFQLPRGLWIDWVLMPEFDNSHNVKAVVTSSRDITERKIMENRAVESLREKEVLLRELYHRTKNNMQVIYSLLALEASKSANESSRDAFESIGLKIQAMALVHQKLYESHDLTSINLNDYIPDIATLILGNYAAASERISTDLIIDSCLVLIDVAIPFGLIINELMTNSVKHAFPDSLRGKIAIELHSAGDEITLTYRDDGVGIPPGIDPLTSPSLGLLIIREIATHQLNGSIRFPEGSGFSCEITVRTRMYRKRV